MLEQFPFEILGFHADNGSEYVNHKVAEMLDKLRIEFTRSRPRRSNDNGLAETKNGAIVRKLFGYEYIPQRHAVRFNTFCIEYLNPFLNFHRPCFFATDKTHPGSHRLSLPLRGCARSRLRTSGRAPIHCPRLQPIDSLRAADLRPLQAHT